MNDPKIYIMEMNKLSVLQTDSDLHEKYDKFNRNTNLIVIA